MDTINVKAVLSNLTKGGQPCYQLYVKNARPMSQDEFVKKFAAAIKRSCAEARYINDVHGQVFCECIVQNRIVNTGSLRGFLTICGSIPSVGAPVNPVSNPVTAVILAHGELKESVANVIAVNDTQVVDAALYTIQYGTSNFLNTIEGTGTVKANGKGLKITTSNTDEGIWLETLDGVMASNKATISANDENTADFAFAALPETTDGDQFRLVIATRNGQSKDEYGVVRLERIVRVIPANA